MNLYKRLFLTLTKRLRRFRQKHTYWTIQNSSRKISFSVIGHPGGRHPYSRLYLEDSGKTAVRQHLYKGGSEMARSLVQSRGLVVLSDIDLPAELAEHTLRVPKFIEVTIALPTTVADYYSGLPHSSRDDIRRTRKAGFSYEISRDISWTGEFFNNFYQPSMQGQHGDEAYVMPQLEIEALLDKQQAEFVKLYSRGTCIAAMLTQIQGNRFTFLRLGWLNNDRTYVKAGAVSALYWFSIQRAIQMRCSELQLGGTPAYLENGVLRFKAKWGGQLSGKRSACYGHQHLLLDPAHATCYRFLNSYSLLACVADNSYVVLSSKDPDQVALPGQFLRTITDWYRLRPDRSDQPTEDSTLPALLKNWYERVPMPTFKQSERISER